MFLAINASEFESATAGSPELVRRNNHLVVGLDAAAVESFVCKNRMPLDYNSGSNVTGTVRGIAASATSGAVRVRLEFEACGAQDFDSDGFASAVEVTSSAASGTNGVLFDAVFTLSNSNMDAVAAGGLFRVKISRVGSDGADTMTGDFQVQDLVLEQ